MSPDHQRRRIVPLVLLAALLTLVPIAIAEAAPGNIITAAGNGNDTLNGSVGTT
jgi:hypothetical protein